MHVTIIYIIKINPTEFSGTDDTPTESVFRFGFFWNAVKFELVHPKAVQTLFVFGHGKVRERKAVETERKNQDSLIISVGMKSLELNEILVMDLLELELVVSAENMNYQGTGNLPREWQWWEGGELCEAQILIF